MAKSQQHSSRKPPRLGPQRPSLGQLVAVAQRLSKALDEARYDEVTEGLEKHPQLLLFLARNGGCLVVTTAYTKRVDCLQMMCGRVFCGDNGLIERENWSRQHLMGLACLYPEQAALLRSRAESMPQ